MGTGEAQIAEFAAAMAFPILPCNLCGSQDGLKRDAMTRLMNELEKEHPNVRAVMASALANVRPTHLLDREVAAAWAARPADVRPVVVPEKREERNPALPVRVGGRLPVVS
jgi:tRNA 2-thiocytidine biosynthesis protein TtcA